MTSVITLLIICVLICKSSHVLFIGALRTVVCGGVGGVSLWIAIFPFDVIKSRVQISNSTEPMMKMMLRIIRTEGTVYCIS